MTSQITVPYFFLIFLCQTYKNVYMGPDKEGASIIAFYNEIFIPSLKEYIYKFQVTIPVSHQLM